MLSLYTTIMSSRILGSASPLAKYLCRSQQVVYPAWRAASTQAERKVKVNVPETVVSTLPNGMTVATESLGTPTCTVGLWIDVGSRYETAKNNGVAHFLEHMFFKGTGKRSRTQLELEVENMGAHLNAYTSRETTVFYAKCLSKDVEKAMDILSDIIQNSKLDEQDIERERDVILREMEEVETNMQEVIFDHLHATAYQGTPLGRTILGPTQNIKSLKRQDLTNFIKTHYTPSRFVLAGAGGVEHQKLKDLGEKYFGNLGKTDDTSLQKDVSFKEPCRFTGGDVRIRDDFMPLCHVAIAVETCGWKDPDNIPLMIANMACGSWDRSMMGGKDLVSLLATKFASNPAAHSFMSFNTNYSDTGLWGAYFIGEGQQMQLITDYITTEWVRICQMISDVEVERAKNVLKANMRLQLDGTTPICEDIGRQMLAYGRRVPLEEMEYRIDAVTPQKVKDTCIKYIYDRCPALATVGPCGAVPDYPSLRSDFYWLRY
ncbi:mitochondrial-processing peptidase subunit beta-like [Saccostrea echinata]|uniref:mitochondrial-processing peptidase subunit beta-like n=1 Tax=Saccostrea echinata TaxID=191078 RepID=UPI002A825863|nr:mitochondrial-processing peptidase subunit beta-like [Saccostrea echinata]